MRLALLLLVLSASTVFATGIPVYDAGVDFNTIKNGLQSALDAIKQYAQTANQIKQDAETLAQTVTMVEQGAKQLANMPKGGNILDILTYYSEQGNALLGQVQFMAFTLDQSTRQFDAMYKDIAQITTPEGRSTLLQQMRQARFEMSRTGVQVQSIRDTFGAIYARLVALLGASSLAEGTKALLQVQAQQQALQQQQQQLGLTMQAVESRLQAMKQAEEIVLQGWINDATRQAYAQWYARTPVTLPAGYDGYMLTPARGR
jgi:uncharacterized phage infection (PIP) family protein YhgE